MYFWGNKVVQCTKTIMYGIVARKRKDSENRIYLDMLVYSAHMVIIYIGVSLLHKLLVSDNA